MRELIALHVSKNRIVALYESQSGERTAEEHSRIGAAPLRYGTWRKGERLYAVQFGAQIEDLPCSTIAESQRDFRNGIVAGETEWARKFKDDIARRTA